MKREKLWLIIFGLYSILITVFYLVNTNGWSNKYTELAETCLNDREESLRIKRAMTDELFETREKYETRIDSLERVILQRK
jgi:hypothetical protein